MTVFGNHTIGELADYVNQSNWRIRALARALAAANRQSIQAQDPALPADWNAFIEKWDALRTRCKIAIVAAYAVNLVLAPALVPAESLYQEVSNLVSPVPYGPKDLPELQRRIQALYPIDFDAEPQPGNGSLDIDMRGFAVANAGKTAIKDGVTDAANAAQTTVDNNRYNIALSVGAGVGTLLLLKHFKVI